MLNSSTATEQFPLVSVIVPVYNVESYLGACIESLVQQDYLNLEILLIDDGSRDGSPQLCEEWAQKDTRIRVFHKTNGGLSDARNFGLDQAAGEYIYFVDSDDVVSSHLISVAMDKVLSEKSDMVFFKYRLLSEDGTDSIVSNDADSFPEEGIVTAKQALADLWSWRMPSHSWQYIAKATLYQSIRFPVGQSLEDVATTVRIVGEASAVYYLPSELYYYRIRNSSILGQPSPQLFIDALTSTIVNDEYARKHFPELVTEELKWSVQYLIVNLFQASGARAQFSNGEYQRYEGHVRSLLKAHCKELGWRNLNGFCKLRLVAIRCGLMPLWSTFSSRRHRNTR